MRNNTDGFYTLSRPENETEHKLKVNVFMCKPHKQGDRFS